MTAIAAVLDGTRQWCIEEGDCLAVLRDLPSESVQACVTDPPYDLLSASRNGSGRSNEPANPYGRHGSKGGGFMGLQWDSTGVAFRAETWREVLRVLQPGAHLIAFGGTRTYHRMTCAIEDAGFEIRDSLVWLHGQGFPKSLNLGNGLGTALKPAFEPLVLARKPCRESTVAKQVAATGTGGINIDASRVATAGRPLRVSDSRESVAVYGDGLNGSLAAGKTIVGRWPPNVLLSHAEISNDRCAESCPIAELDRQSGVLTSGKGPLNRHSDKFRTTYGRFEGEPEQQELIGDIGGASRFFPNFHYEAKPSTVERNAGLERLAHCSAGAVTGGRVEGSAGLQSPRAGAGRTSGARNHHPTVKSIALMMWLVQLVTPPAGIVLDPFAGSGSTIIAAQRLGFRAIGIEQQPDYVELARARVVGDAPLFNAAALEKR